MPRGGNIGGRRRHEYRRRAGSGIQRGWGGRLPGRSWRSRAGGRVSSTTAAAVPRPGARARMRARSRPGEHAPGCAQRRTRPHVRRGPTGAETATSTRPRMSATVASTPALVRPLRARTPQSPGPTAAAKSTGRARTASGPRLRAPQQQPHPYPPWSAAPPPPSPPPPDPTTSRLACWAAATARSGDGSGLVRTRTHGCCLQRHRRGGRTARR